MAAVIVSIMKRGRLVTDGRNVTDTCIWYVQDGRRKMKANFEVKAKKNGNWKILYWCMEIYEGIIQDLYERYEARGYTDIEIRMI